MKMKVFGKEGCLRGRSGGFPFDSKVRAKSE